MMKTKILILFFVIMSQISFSQTEKSNNQRYVQVVGNAVSETAPDLILFDICIQEYYKEQYETDKSFKDYTTIISADFLENEIRTQLQAIGIAKSQILVITEKSYTKTSVANALEMRTIRVSVNDLQKVSEIMQKVSSKGISFMRIGELKHKDLAAKQMQIKKDAFANAKAEALVLASAVGATLGQVISIEEVEENPLAKLSDEQLYNAAKSAQTAAAATSIVLKYSVKVTFQLQ